jgi:hypothetical protein
MSGRQITRQCARSTNQGGQIVGYLWEILRYFAAWGGTGLIIWFWYWLFSNIGTF